MMVNDTNILTFLSTLTSVPSKGIGLHSMHSLLRCCTSSFEVRNSAGDPYGTWCPCIQTLLRIRTMYRYSLPYQYSEAQEMDGPFNLNAFECNQLDMEKLLPCDILIVLSMMLVC